MGLAAYNPFMGQTIRTDAGTAVDRVFIAHYTIAAADADAAAPAYIEAATVLAAAPTTVLAAALSAQPPTPRVLSITGDAAGSTGDVVITGTDAAGAALTETIVGIGAATVIGTRAFATISSIVFPIGNGVSTISVGISDYIGLPYLLSGAQQLLSIYNNGTATTAAAASSYSATVLSLNFIDPTAALAGAQIDVYMLV